MKHVTIRGVEQKAGKVGERSGRSSSACSVDSVGGKRGAIRMRLRLHVSRHSPRLSAAATSRRLKMEVEVARGRKLGVTLHLNPQLQRCRRRRPPHPC